MCADARAGISTALIAAAAKATHHRRIGLDTTTRPPGSPVEKKQYWNPVGRRRSSLGSRRSSVPAGFGQKQSHEH
jgi:hypothetical protein